MNKLWLTTVGVSVYTVNCINSTWSQNCQVEFSLTHKTDTLKQPFLQCMCCCVPSLSYRHSESSCLLVFFYLFIFFLVSWGPWSTVAGWVPSHTGAREPAAFYINIASKATENCFWKKKNKKKNEKETGGFCLCRGAFWRMGNQPHGNCVGEEYQAFRKQQTMRPSPVCSATDSLSKCLRSFNRCIKNLKSEENILIPLGLGHAAIIQRDKEHYILGICQSWRSHESTQQVTE